MSLGQALNLVNGPTVADAIRAPDNDIAQLVAFERDPRTIIEELYVRFLCRAPTEVEVEKLTAMFDTGDIANASGLSDADHTDLMARFEQWQATVPRAVWHPLDSGNAKAAGGAELVELPDGSLLLKGPKPAKDDYTIVGWTDRPRDHRPPARSAAARKPAEQRAGSRRQRQLRPGEAGSHRGSARRPDEGRFGEVGQGDRELLAGRVLGRADCSRTRRAAGRSRRG